MKLIENIDSTAINAVRAGDDSIVTITFNNGKSYDYRDTTGNFVNSVENAIQNDKSVGRLYNRAVKEDQTLQLITV